MTATGTHQPCRTSVDGLLLFVTLIMAMAVAIAPRRSSAAQPQQVEGYGTVKEIGKDSTFFVCTLNKRDVAVVLGPRAVIVQDTPGKLTDLVTGKYAILLGKLVSHPEVPEKITPDDVLRGTLKELKKGSFTAKMIIFGPVGLPPGYDARTAQEAAGDDLMQARIKSVEEGLEVTVDETKPFTVTPTPETQILLTPVVKADAVKVGAPVYLFGSLRNKDEKKEPDIKDSIVLEAQMFRLINPKAFSGPRYEQIVKKNVGM